MTLVLVVSTLAQLYGLGKSPNHAGMKTPKPKQENKWDYPHPPNPDYLLDFQPIRFSFLSDF